MREEGMKYRRRREMTRMRIDVGKECQKNDIERRMSKKWTEKMNEKKNEETEVIKITPEEADFKVRNEILKEKKEKKTKKERCKKRKEIFK